MIQTTAIKLGERHSAYPSPFCEVHRGFTMLEVLVVLIILAIMMSLASLGFSSLAKRTKAASAAYDVSGTLIEARFDALTHNHRTGVAIDLLHRRLLLFVDSTADNQYALGSFDRVLRNWQPLDSAGTLSASGTQTTNNGQIVHVVFEVDGSTSNQFELVSKVGTDSTRVKITPATGLIRLVRM